MLLVGPAHALEADKVEAPAAFEILKKLAGEWEGTTGTPDGAPARVSVRVSASGNTVIWTEFPGSNHEMTSMMHLDGNELVLKHYCIAGNQPEMKLDRARSTARELNWVFTGGTNLDPAKDPHVHAGKMLLPEENRIDADWDFHENGRKTGSNRFFLKRRTPVPRVVHFQITAQQPERAVRFYTDVFGWQFQKWEGPESYWLITTGPEDKPGINGGLAPRTEPGESGTVNTVQVSSVDRYVASVEANGGKVLVAKRAIPGVGWLAYCQDTEGNTFGLMEPDPAAK
jgi:predicted enzyme related to lactoylglutathione lyase